MSTGCSIGEPYVLASYSLPTRNTSQPYIYASHEPDNDGEGAVTLAVQGDGLHVIDLSSLHPQSSKTLGPSTFFSTNAVSRIETSEDGQQVHAIYCVLESSADQAESENGRVICRWDRDVKGGDNMGSSQTQRTVMEDRVHSIFAPASLPSRLAVVSRTGDLSLLKSDLSSVRKATHTKNLEVLHASIFNRNERSFHVGHQISPAALISIVVGKCDGDLALQLSTVIPDEDAIKILDPISIPLPKEDIKDVREVSFSISGVLSVLMSSSKWCSFILESANGSPVLTPLTEPTLLNRTLFIPSTSSTSSHIPPRISAMTSSHVAMAVTSHSSPEIDLLVWDVRYSVVLASHKIHIPSNLTTESKHVTTSLTCTPTQCILILSSNTSTKSKSASQARSTAFIVPVVLPAESTISNAMGRRNATSKWLRQPDDDSSNITSDPHEDVVGRVRVALEQNVPERANEIFMEWIRLETEKLQAELEPPTGAPDDQGAPHATRPDQSTKHHVKDKENVKPFMSHRLVSRLLHTILIPAASHANCPYSPKVVSYLLNRRLVSQGMLEGGVTTALQQRGDWDTLTEAIRFVPDITEDSLMSLLHSVFVAHKSKGQASENAMAVDQEANVNVPPLSEFLTLCVQYKTSAASLRSAIKRQISSTEEIMDLLELLTTWVEKWSAKGPTLGFTEVPAQAPEGDAKKPKGKKSKWTFKRKAEGMPPLENIIVFLQIFIDTNFVLLLQDQRSREFLQRLSKCLNPQIHITMDLEDLRGPLEPFVKAQTRVANPDEADSKVSAERRSRQTLQEANAGVKPYQIEEIWL
ncbi:hypothetical protein SISSUDRAFT_1125184 [Sistotremastrum suecicum HHB10207 ss-3]|uniref:Uncharacterized protein n=1 Tax=Sistotremastrum suecicum HHB10207 ss-3 TaxID=1314776 RepID=A0A166HPL9_9AGAM|nr:hypothetical protein SISSUDRAFT_1125184 [Sistotremastrum suecicum HHB10207 ss-3]